MISAALPEQSDFTALVLKYPDDEYLTLPGVHDVFLGSMESPWQLQSGNFPPKETILLSQQGQFNCLAGQIIQSPQQTVVKE